jgi:hypothetical protein
MSEPIVVYDNGNVYIIDSSEIYVPFPEPKAEPVEEESSQELQSL